METRGKVEPHVSYGHICSRKQGGNQQVAVGCGWVGAGGDGAEQG